ncbi:Dynein regulatory complex protein 11 (IQ and AAA domain-containing protein 1), partial [Durusdinium trenchii]
TFDLKWQEAMAELNEQLHVEDHTLSLKDGEQAPSLPQVTVQEAVQHWSCLYIRYLDIFGKLEECYDGIVHPQKRIDIKLIMELVMTRVLELKVLEVPIPRYFREEFADTQVGREKLIAALKTVKLGEDSVLPVEQGRDKEFDKPLVQMTLEEAIDCLQTAERGRQGIVRGQLVRDLLEEEQAEKTAAFGAHKIQTVDTYGLDPEVAAANIQRLYRGNKSRRKALEERDRELAFIGMRRGNVWDDVEAKRTEEQLMKELEVSRDRRKHEQKENENAYSEDLIELHGTVLEEEGPDMREKMMDERRAWFTEELGKGVFPEDLGGFYLAKNPHPEEDESGEGDANKGGGKDAKKGGKKDAKKDAKKGGEEEEVEKIPPLSGPSVFSQTLKDSLDRYDEIWLERDESDNFQQKHDVSLAKNVVRPNVEEEVRENVDKMLVVQLQNLKTQLEAAASGGKKGKKKKDKGKKGKKGKKDKKGKKGKALPGEKLCSGMELEEMLGLLIEHGVVRDHSPCRVQDLVGEFNYLGSSYQQHSEVRDVFGNWVPQDPSTTQIRQAITEQIILPLGCSFLRATAPYAKSVLLYGPRGSGKTMMAQAVAQHTRALFLNLSPEVLENVPKEFREGKSGPTRLVHMAFAVARHPDFAPAVIYIDEIDRIFVGKKKGSGGDAAKFRKDIVTYANSLKPEERVVLLGCTSQPFNIPEGEFKDIKAVFQRQLYLANPDYASRVLLWRMFLQRAFDEVELDIPERIDISALALVSEGYSAGTIETCVRKTLTERRKATLKTRPITEKDFINPLSSLPVTYQQDNLKFQQFTAAITGLRDRQERVKALKDGDDAGDKKKKKK